MLLKGICSIINLRNKQKYSISNMFTDNEFEVLEAEINKVQVTLNATASSDHVPEIEPLIHVIKELVQAIWNTLLYTYLPSRMIAQMVSYAVIWINGLPVVSGVYSTLSPCTIMTGTTLDFKKNLKN